MFRLHISAKFLGLKCSVLAIDSNGCSSNSSSEINGVMIALAQFALIEDTVLDSASSPFSFTSIDQLQS